MKHKIILLLTFFVLAGSIKMAAAQENPTVMYTAMYRYNHIHCTFLVNNMPIHSSSSKRPILMSFMGRVGALLAEGENTFSIWAMNIPEDPQGAYCEMIINATVYNPKTDENETKEVSSLRVTIDQKGNFVTTESKVYSAPTLTGDITVKELDKHTYKQGVRNDVIATRSLTVNHPHRFYSWATRATPFVDTPANREKLWAKYEEFRLALAEKDEARYRALMAPGSIETERYMGDPATNAYFESQMEFVHEAWAAEDFEVLPIDKEKYELVISADGRLFRFVNTFSNNHTASPVVYKDNGRERVFNYSFTLVDGEIVNAY